MTSFQKCDKYRLAKDAIIRAGLELFTIDLEEDYIEAVCPECRRNLIFHFGELDSIRCERCYLCRQREEFEKKSKDLVEAAGFTLRMAIFDEDYIEIECPKCGEITSLYSYELEHVCCRYCAMEEAAAEKGYTLYMGESIEGEPWEAQFDAWLESSQYDWGAAIVCPGCKVPHFFGIGALSTLQAVEYVRNYKCKCVFSPEKLKKYAEEKGFSIEYNSSPYGNFALEQGEVAFLCNQCGDEIILHLNDPEINDKLENLECSCTSSGSDEDHLAWTRQGRIAWCADVLNVISLVDLTTFNQSSFDGVHYLHFPKEGKKEVFFAADPDSLDYAYAFVIYPNEADVWLSKYLLFRFQIATWGTAKVSVEVFGRWPHYYKELYEAICQDIDDGDKRVAKIVEKNFDCYISAYNALHSRQSDIWNVGRVLSTFEELRNALGKLNGKAQEIRDRHLKRYIALHTCPVCKKAYTSSEQKCLECGFPDLNRVFINQQEAERWYEWVVVPYKQRYNRKEQ